MLGEIQQVMERGEEACCYMAARAWLKVKSWMSAHSSQTPSHIQQPRGQTMVVGGVEVGDRHGSIAERQDSGISEDQVDSSETLWGESRLGRLMSPVVPYGVD